MVDSDMDIETFTQRGFDYVAKEIGISINEIKVIPDNDNQKTSTVKKWWHFWK